MSFESREMREERKSLHEEMKKEYQENRDNLTPEVQQKIDRMGERIATLNKLIPQEERVADTSDGCNNRQETADEIAERLREQPQRKGINQRDKDNALSAWMLGPARSKNFERDQAIARKAGLDITAQSITVPLHEGRATTGMGWGAGSTLVDQEAYELVPQLGIGAVIEKKMKNSAGVRQVATVIPTATGADFVYPTVDDTTVRASIVDENAASTEHTFETSGVRFKAYKYSSKIIRVSNELMVDSVVPMEALLGELIGERMARGTNYDFTLEATSSGNRPDGVFGGTTAAAGAVPDVGTQMAAYDNVTLAELLTFRHTVDPYYRETPNTRWMFGDHFLMDLITMSLATTNSFPVWLPSLREGEPDTILGKPYIVNPDTLDPSSANGESARKVCAFGDFSKYIIREVNGIEIVRLNERYAEYYETAFVGFLRTDAHCVQTSAIKVLVTASSS